MFVTCKVNAQICGLNRRILSYQLDQCYWKKGIRAVLLEERVENAKDILTHESRIFHDQKAINLRHALEYKQNYTGLETLPR